MNDSLNAERIAPGLSGVPETTLMTLWHRSAYADGPQNLLDDSLVRDLVTRIDYDFKGHFGNPNPAIAIRSRYADDLLRDFLRHYPDASVVVLGEGLETQFWRVDNGRMQWFSVDLAESIALRQRLLPAHERNTLIACSALDDAWIDQVLAHTQGPLFISAAGLLMYFTEVQVLTLLRTLVSRFKTGEVFFDTIPPWFSRMTLRGWKLTPRYTAPPMPWGIRLGNIKAFTRQVPGLELLESQTYADPYPQFVRVLAVIAKIPLARDRWAPGLVHCRF